jgi:nitroimidazol reductase NimA-like FMN-containing flavoprotein (pyridoxamine 5'-phosphate oxidase superfamily)
MRTNASKPPPDLAAPGGAGPPLRRTARTTLKRRPARGAFDRQLAYAILDAAPICHVGIATGSAAGAGSEPYVIPMAFGRWGDRLVLHGAPASRLLGAARSAEVCVTVTIVDGLVLARSAMHHSMNFRSLLMIGRAVEIVEAEEKLEALRRVVEHLLPGRWQATRAPSPAELRATSVLLLPIDEASVKMRAGGPLDDVDDQALPHWAGVVPLTLSAGRPIAAADLHPQAPPPPAPGVSLSPILSSLRPTSPGRDDDANQP